MNPIQLLTETLPALFNGAYAEIRAQADAGDPRAKQRRDELNAAAPLAIRVVLEGTAKRDIHLVFENGELKASERASALPAAFAFGVGHEEFEVALEELAPSLERGLAKLRKRLPELSPARGRSGIDRLAAEKLLFHYIVKDTPDFAEVRVKVALGGAEPPEKPAFTLTVDYDTIEQLRAKKLKPQALLSKLQVTGDASRALQLAMGALQKRG